MTVSEGCPHHGPGEPDGDQAGEADAYLARLAELAGAARATSSAGAKAAALLEAQRVAAWGLREAVALARNSGMSWRDLSALLDMPAATLHRKYQQGGGLFSAGDVPPSDLAPLLPTARPDSAARTPVAGGNGMPSLPMNLFVGRNRELADLPVLLRQNRLVTVTGPGGVGKSRLALEVAHRASGLGRGGVFWVPLAGLPTPADSSQVVAAVTAAVQRGHSHYRPIDEVIRDSSATGPVLLVLDGCEHLTAGCGEVVARLLATHSALTVLAVSREALGVAGEVRVRLDPLPAVRADSADPWLAGSAAVRLFADRARLAAHDVVLAGQEQSIARVCNALDGVPLAIELAARQCAVLPVAALEAHVDRQLDLPAAHPGSILGPHAGLRASVAWSYDLLAPAERALFRRLSLLPDGASDLTAVALSAGLGLNRAGVWAALTSLAGKSVLTTSAAAPRRFGMLAAAREYGRERLGADGETAAVEELLLSWLASQAENTLNQPRVRAQASVAEPVAAFRFAAELARNHDDPRYPVLALVTALQLSWQAEMDDARRVLEPLLAETGLRPDDAARAQRQMAAICHEGGDFAAARRYAQRAHTIALAGCNPLLQDLTASTLIYSLDDSSAAEAAELGRQQVAYARTLGDADRLASDLNNLGWDLAVCGRTGEARAAIEEMLALRRDTVAPWERQTAGTVALVSGAVREASLHFTAGLRDCTSAATVLDLVQGVALVAVHDGHAEWALRLLAGAAAHRERLGLARVEWWSQQTAAA
ncbi:MAG: hypothetical protein JWO79_5005, partial [Actinomycetia bacterium]|nr:hypothetical protein [Actinomycetes bacterium]